MEQEEMKVKNKWMLAVFLILTMVTCLMITACGGPDPVPEEDLIELTLEELAQFDGKEGRPAYIAVDGDIYDVSKVSRWRNGQHNGFTAGNDLTEEIKAISPHGVSKLKTVPMIGRVKDES